MPIYTLAKALGIIMAVVVVKRQKKCKESLSFSTNNQKRFSMHLKTWLVTVIFCLSITGIYSQTPPKDLHQNWNTLLTTYVDKQGNVDYKNLKGCAPKIDAYLAKLSANAPNAHWTKNEKLAFYINLYNAGTVKLILDHYPLKSIKDISKPWDRDWLKVGNQTLSLGDIEHKILRKMKEPRIHFAINCASYSCPALKNEAFIAVTMEKQLEETAYSFINDSKRNKISAEKIELSEIFKWFKKDFTTKGSLLDFINPYTTTTLTNKTKVSYLDYNWSLNE